MPFRRSALTAILVAVVATAAVAVIRLTLPSLLGGLAPFLPFTLAVIASAAYGGWLGGIVATALGALVGVYLFMPPRFELRIDAPGQAAALVVFMLVSLAICWVTVKLLEARQRADEEREARLAGERNLREQEEQLEKITDNSPVMLAHCSRDLHYRFVNRACAEFIGRPREEIVDRPIAEVLGPEAFAAIRPLIDRVLDGESIEWELEVPYRTGPRLMHVNYVPDRNARGEIEGWFASIQDITSRRLVEDERREIEARFRSVQETNLDGFALLEAVREGGTIVDFRWVYINESGARTIGKPRDWFIGRRLLEEFPGNRDEGLFEAYVWVVESGNPEIREIEYRREELDICVRLSVAKVGDGVAAQFTDLSERRRAERAMRESEERFRELANNIDQFAWTCDRLGEATWYSRRWYDYTGTSFEEMKGDGWKRVQHPAHVDRVSAGLQKCVASGEPWEDTFPLRGKNGQYRWFLSRAIPIRDGSGQVTRWLGTNTDVTELRELQEALREADRRKDEFLATLAHELRNPLAPVRNAVQVLRMKGPPSPELQWARSVIDRQVQQMTRLIDDLMDVSRITHDNLELRKERIELAQVLHGAIETSRPAIDAAKQELVLRVPDEAMYVEADPTRLAQVFSNLLNNAAKYSDAPGTIVLTAESRDGEVEVVVRDQGIGIAPAMLPRIFDLFVQAGESRARRDGLGIGLTLVRRLVEMHGGTVRAESEGVGKGSGSAFTVRLPLAAAPARAVTVEERETKKAEGRVLLVDDNRDAAESLGLLLDAVGYETRLAFDGASALAAAAEFRPDVVLLDIGMPDMSGHEVARRLREAPGGRDVVLVAVTGWGQAEDRRKSDEAGFDRHLVKPVDPRALIDLLRDLTADGRGAAAS